MSNRENDIDRFDDYLSGRMTNSEKLALEEELGHNELLQEEFESYRQAIEIIKLNAIRSETGRLIDSERKNRRFWLIPASAAAALLGFFLWVGFDQPSSYELFQTHFEPYPDISTTRSPTHSIKAWRLYSDGAYEDAISELRLLRRSDTSNFYLAMCYMQLDQFQLADQHLDLVDERSIFKNHKIWYKALIKLASSQEDSAAFYLKKVPTGGYGYTQSQQILESME